MITDKFQKKAYDARPDGRLGADLSTIVFAAPHLPRLETALHTAASPVGAAI